MDHTPPSVEVGGFAEEDIFSGGVIELAYGLDALEPHDLHHRAAIGKQADEPGLSPFPLHVEADEFAFDLQRWHVVACEVDDAVDGAAVDVVGREVEENVMISPYAEILFKKFGTLGANSTKEFYVHSSQSVHDVSGGFTVGPDYRELSAVYRKWVRHSIVKLTI